MEIRARSAAQVILEILSCDFWRKFLDHMGMALKTACHHISRWYSLTKACLPRRRAPSELLMLIREYHSTIWDLGLITAPLVCSHQDAKQ